MRPLHPLNNPHYPSFVPQSAGACPPIWDYGLHPAQTSATWMIDRGFATLRRASYIALPCGKLLTSAALLSHRKHDRAAALTTTFDGARIMRCIFKGTAPLSRSNNHYIEPRNCTHHVKDERCQWQRKRIRTRRAKRREWSKQLPDSLCGD